MWGNAIALDPDIATCETLRLQLDPSVHLALLVYVPKRILRGICPLGQVGVDDG